MKSIRWKLVILYLSLVFIVMILAGTVIVISTDNREKSKASEELRQGAIYIEEQVINLYDAESFQENIAKLSFINQAQRSINAYILDKEGRTIASSTLGNIEDVPSFKNSAVIAAINGKESFVDNISYTDFGKVRNVMVYAYPCNDANGELEFIAYVQMDKEAINSILLQTTRSIAIAAVIALIFTAIIGLLFASTITSPISLLTKNADLMAKGSLEQNVKVNSDDEIGQLTESFNTMARELRKTLEQMGEQRNRLEIILHNMTDGILAFDERGNLIHINKSSYEMLDIIEDKDVNISLNWLYDKLKIKAEDIYKDDILELTLNENNKYISVAVMSYAIKTSDYGVIVVLHDITKHRQLDNMRQEFVANVSHEIGTPLTTIKGYAELLIDGALYDDVAIDFLKEINVAADRMKVLRDDLLDLSRFDTNVNKINKEYIDLVELVKGCLRQNIIVANNKLQTVAFTPPENSMMIYADTSRINQVITNILSNAMKYSYENTEISVELQAVNSQYRLSISDQGIGMPKDSLDRIFERFYRVDKARSRAMGGNGLGLSIAKEIMVAHNGDIEVSSQVGIGTTMTLIFNKV